MTVTAQKSSKPHTKVHPKTTKPAPVKSARPTKWGTELIAKMDAFRKALAAQK